MDTRNNRLYFHALTGYTLYGIDTEILNDFKRLASVEPFRLRTAAPDGMIIDAIGNLYFADLEMHKIQYLLPDRKTIKTLVEGDEIKWADSFSIHDGYLYFTNSRIHEAGADVRELTFTINTVALPNFEGAP